MITGTQKAAVLRAVIGGASLPEAARSIGIKPTQAHSALKTLCRRFRLMDEVADIRADPARYEAALVAFEASPEIGLGRALADKLTEVLQLPPQELLTPRYVSNITASQLLENGLTQVNVHAIETWLIGNGLGLKRAAPSTDKELEEVKKWLSLLGAYGFDKSAAQRQLDHLLSQLNPEPVAPDA